VSTTGFFADAPQKWHCPSATGQRPDAVMLEMHFAKLYQVTKAQLNMRLKDEEISCPLKTRVLQVTLPRYGGDGFVNA
jgi:hypothetical protein